MSICLRNANEIHLNISQRGFVEDVQYLFGFQELENLESVIIQSLKAEKSTLF